jgi:hypothetical protein
MVLFSFYFLVAGSFSSISWSLDVSGRWFFQFLSPETASFSAISWSLLTFHEVDFFIIYLLVVGRFFAISWSLLTFHEVDFFSFYLLVAGSFSVAQLYLLECPRWGFFQFLSPGCCKLFRSSAVPRSRNWFRVRLYNRPRPTVHT